MELKVGGTGIDLVDTLFENAGIDSNRQKWDGLYELYNVLATSIIEISEAVNESINTIRSLGAEGNPELLITINGFINDINTFTDELIKIKSRHEGKTGFVADGDELVSCLSIFNDYTIFGERFKAIVFPAYLTITEQLLEVSVKFKKQKAEEQATVGEVNE